MLVLVAACGTSGGGGAEPGDGTTYRYVIPAGTGEAIDAGEPVDIVPARLDLDVGDTIEIVNEDDRGHRVGPFFVGEGETARQTFPSPAEFLDTCSIHPSGQFEIVVS